MTNQAKWLLATLAMSGMGGTAYAQSAPPGSTPANSAADAGPGGEQWRQGGGHDDARDGDDGEHRDGWNHEHGRQHEDGYHQYRHRGGINGMMVHLLHQLNLTDAQKQSVQKILADARTQEQSRRKAAPAPNLAALANPGDPKHAAALQDLQTRVAAHIRAKDQIYQQIYGVLTPEQKTQLAATLATRQAKMAAQRSAAG